MDLGLGEIQEIGEMVEEYTSDTSTVVIGTAIDMDLEGEIRVTVVATGINGAEEGTVKLVKNTPKENIEISPSYMKHRINSNAAHKIDANHEEDIIKAEKDPMMSEDYLDIPAFLRNQAD